MNCTFFGHRHAPDAIEEALRSTIIKLIEERNVKNFYIGNHGNFDKMAKRIIASLIHKYPHIKYSIVLAYLPTEKNSLEDEYYLNTIYPDGLEKTPRKYAIIKRNKWMIDKSDYVITYVKYIGGASQFKELAEKKGKTVINISDS